jgi:hypothetical protein
MPVRRLAHEVEAREVSEGSRWSIAKDQPNRVSVSGETARLNDRGLGPAKPFKASSHKGLHEQAGHTCALDSCCRSDTYQTQRGSHPNTGSS